MTFKLNYESKTGMTLTDFKKLIAQAEQAGMPENSPLKGRVKFNGQMVAITVTEPGDRA